MIVATLEVGIVWICFPWHCLHEDNNVQGPCFHPFPHFKTIEQQPMFSSITTMCILCSIGLQLNTFHHYIYKHEIDLKLYALTFKVGKYITREF